MSDQPLAKLFIHRFIVQDFAFFKKRCVIVTYSVTLQQIFLPATNLVFQHHNILNTNLAAATPCYMLNDTTHEIRRLSFVTEFFMLNAEL